MASSQHHLRPPYDPLLVEAANMLATSAPGQLDLKTIRSMSRVFTADAILKSHPEYLHAEYYAKGLKQDDPEVLLSVFTPKDTQELQPAVYINHPGGQVAGNRFLGVESAMDFTADTKTVLITVEYRLAPEQPAPAAVHDSYAGLQWVVANSAALHVDPSRLIVFGCSGGAPIAAGACILSHRDNKEYPLGLMLCAPMLDDRAATVSSRQFEFDGTWCAEKNRKAWDHVLGDRPRGEGQVDEVIAPSRSTVAHLVDMPPTFIDVSACEVFRDEAVAFASKLWEAGVSAEIHVWPGGFHGFDAIGMISLASVPVVDAAKQAKRSWVNRLLHM